MTTSWTECCLRFWDFFVQDNSGREKFSRTLIVFTLQQLPLISSQMWEELRGIDTLDSFS